MVMSQSCLADLVIAEELEVIICGSTVSGRDHNLKILCMTRNSTCVNG